MGPEMNMAILSLLVRQLLTALMVVVYSQILTQDYTTNTPMAAWGPDEVMVHRVTQHLVAVAIIYLVAERMDTMVPTVAVDAALRPTAEVPCVECAGVALHAI
jgi:hypothetical protein